MQMCRMHWHLLQSGLPCGLICVYAVILVMFTAAACSCGSLLRSAAMNQWCAGTAEHDIKGTVGRLLLQLNSA